MANYKNMFKSSSLSLLVASVLLTGCGGDDAAELSVEKFDPTVSIETKALSIFEREEVVLNADAFDKNGTIVSYEWTITNPNQAPITLAGADTKQVSFTTPEVTYGDENLEYKIKVTVTDDEGNTVQDSVNVTNKPIVEEVKLYGQVKYIIQPIITAYVGDQVITIEDSKSYSDGIYDFDLIVDENNVDEMIKLVVNGRESITSSTGIVVHVGQQNVEYVSLLPNIKTLQSRHGANEALESFEEFGLNINAMTTAQFVLATELAKSQLSAEVEPSLADIFALLPIFNGEVAVVDGGRHYDALTLAAIIHSLISLEGEETLATIPEEMKTTLEYVSQSMSTSSVAALKAKIVNAIGLERFTEIGIQIGEDGNYVKVRDTDFDGKLDNVDDDIDGDGVYNLPDSLPKDFAPYDSERSSPVFADLFWGKDGHDGHLLHCIFKSQSEKVTWNFSDSESSLSRDYFESKLLNEIEVIDCTGEPATTDLEHLQYFTSLKFLALPDTDISVIPDITVWSQMTELEYLDLSNAKITDFSVIANFTKLTTLKLARNALIDLGFLQNLANVEVLDLSGNLLSNIEKLASFNQLTELTLSNNDITTVAGVESFTGLTQLKLDNNNLSDLPSLAGLNELSVFKVDNNQIGVLPEFSTSAVLTELAIHNNEIVDLTPIAGFNTLTTLNLDHNKIVSLDSLTSFTELTQLTANNNAINDISELVNLTLLSTLSLNNNQITDLSSLAGLEDLTTLNLTNNNIADISSLANVSIKDKLLLDTNLLIDITAILAWAELPEYMDLRANSISCEDDASLKELADVDTYVKDAEGNIIKIITHTYFGDCIEKLIPTHKPFSNTSLLDVFDAGAVQEGGDYEYLNGGMKESFNEHVSCLYYELTMYAPICVNSPMNQGGGLLCYAVNNDELDAYRLDPDTHVKDKDATQMFCVNPFIEEFSIAFDIHRESAAAYQPGQPFVDDFSKRHIMNLLNSHHREVNINAEGYSDLNSCALQESGDYVCTMTSKRFSQPVTWLQDNEHGGFPECSGLAETTIATCRPRFLAPENVDKYDFTLDISEAARTYIPRVEFVPECGTQQSSCEQ
ncbi:leucine-rich repeat domain-containing protein [Thalassotalea psychrophila]|uniref:Leucine-rich repeat domain-containing protein n=1 Tax=Thalassotalea psychrophila TaxID=3065647 RepID=A0ABY9TYP5_9GAMM|nr:leucine-rich repeat domain-containing protein [Colwelliaceae bacterium SQ149]